MKKVTYSTTSTRSIYRLFCCLIAIPLLLSLWHPGAKAIDVIEVNSARALLVEPASGEVLYEKNADEHANPASLTKIMTALLILEYGKFDEVVTVSASALDGLHPAGSSSNLKVGEEISLENLLYCILIASGNDACNAAAEHIAGSIPAFVALMNNRAKELNCKDTHFANAHGLTQDDHYTTARDLYKIVLEALKHPRFLEICNTASITIPATNKSEERYFYTTNHLISPLKLPDYLYPYAKGIKTGYTSAAGNCLISCAEKDDLFLVSIVMGAEKEEETGRIMSFVDTKNLFEWAFSNFSYQTVISSREPITEVKVRLAQDSDYVVLNTSNSVEALLPNDFDPADVVREIVVYDENQITAPITKGQKLGEISLTYKGRSYGTLNLVALNSVQRDQVLYYMDQFHTFMSQTWVRAAIIGLAALLVLYIIIAIIYNRRRRRMNRRYYRGSRRRR
ncbi:MAG: D-alanyl-D-alanine carboxypeptidase family protein [Eubacteriales bacterium]|jgi:D-alanyl-D-alanine carboxypeptidase (penicillin-binding protein 5/6)